MRLGVGEQVGLRLGALPNERGDVRIPLRGLAEPLPHRQPGTLAPGQEFSALEIAVVLRIKRELRLADLHETNPCVLAAGGPERITLVEPLKQIAHRVSAGQEGVEIVLVKALAFQKFDLFIHKTVERELHGVLGALVLGYIQSKSTLF